MNNRLRRALPVILVLLMFVGLPIGIVGYNYWESRNTLRRELDDFEAVTGVRTLEDLRPAPVPDDENAAIVYRQAFSALDAANLSEDEWDILFQIPEVDDIDALTAILERARPAIDPALDAAAMERCDWQTAVYDEGKDAPLPHLPYTQELVRVLAADAYVSIQSGEEVRARTLLIGSLGIRDHLFSEHTLISFMVAVAIESRVLSLMSRTWDRWSDASVKALRDRINTVPLREMYQRTLPLEALVGLQFFDDPDEIEFIGHDGGHEANRSNWNEWRDKSLYLARMRELYQSALNDHHERVRPIKDGTLPEWAMLTDQLAGAHTGYSSMIAYAELMRTLLDNAINIEEERRAVGRYPKTWPAVVNPESGEPVPYEVLNDGTGYRFVVGTSRPHRQLSWQVGDWPSDSGGED